MTETTSDRPELQSQALQWLNEAVLQISSNAFKRAKDYQDSLVKPLGSLGDIENIAVHIAAMQTTLHPSVERAAIIVFAADHGIAQEGVSAYPQSVTNEMIKNFSRGGAAISVLARQHGLPFKVVNLGTVESLAHTTLDNVEHRIIGPGSDNILHHHAMEHEQLVKAFAVGKEQVDKAAQAKTQLLILGEMGIANTTVASTLSCALLSLEPDHITGKGTGIGEEALVHKIETIRKVIKHHQGEFSDPLKILQSVGGFEIAAMTAAYLRCAQVGIVALVDGFISSVAALFAVKINKDVKNWLVFSHMSQEPGHKVILEHLQAKPLLSLNMRLGEGSGAAFAYALVKSACLPQSQMASFAQAGVSEKNA